ncbi:MAG TPA: helix-turn-helix domain-containing protein [Pseudonocardia sp.]|jgi:AraC-like DNA-binding protein|uniref:AraC family transcriptional regulator n=1 Tax=Pseudonocardia sp. TaxID=60912 RepID=UPI002B4B6AFF|nr:helix-turn-helix domain-containing protein [Pseudonocardia sp.]HLU58659.1 helix-turn-helix domain-containing protein [Pseudonocardia sp.]
MGQAVFGGALEVVAPARPSQLPGVSLAGFRHHGPGPLDMRVIPHPAVTLAVDVGAGDVCVEDEAGRRRGSFAAGLAFGRLRARGHGVEAVQVRLSPITAYSLLGTCPADLEGAVVALDDLWGRDADRLRERLGCAGSWQDRFALAHELLARRFDDRRRVHPEVARAWRRIVGSRGRVRVDGLAAEVGWSRKRLWARFRSQIGIAPNRAAKLVRFHDAAHRLAAGIPPAHAAAASGYFDQSHLHRDVRAFSGLTPRALAGELFLAVDDVAWPGQGPPVTRQACGGPTSTSS